MKTFCALLIATLICSAVAEDCHDPVTDVGSEAGLAADVCLINTALGKSPPDYATAKLIYEIGKNSKSPTLKDVATAEYDAHHYEEFAEFFGDSLWMDTLITKAFEGEDVFDTDVKRVQMIKKMLQSSVLPQQMHLHIDLMLDEATEGNAEEALNRMEKAMATFYGLAVDCAPFGNGQARGIEFNTLTDGVATPVYKIGSLFAEGGDVLTAKKVDLEKLEEIHDEIARNVVIIYVQTVLKYASLIDEAIENGEDFEKAQAEGFAYYHAIAPLVNEVDPEASTFILETFDLSKEANEADAEGVFAVFRKNFAGLGVLSSEINSFDGDRIDLFDAPKKLACQALNPFTDVKATIVNNDR